MSLIPPVGTEGIYRLRAPFAARMRANTSYRCDSTRRFSEIIEKGGNPYDEYYKPLGISQATFDSEDQNAIAIVSLVSVSGHWIDVPSSYIESFPNQGGIPYRGLVLSIPLGPVPTTMDLTHVKVGVQNFVQDTLGIRAIAQTIAVTEVQSLALTDHNALQAARDNAIRTSPTDSAKARTLQQQYDALLAKYRDLEQYVLQNMP